MTRPRTHSAPARVLPAPRPPIISQVSPVAFGRQLVVAGPEIPIATERRQAPPGSSIPPASPRVPPPASSYGASAARRCARRVRSSSRSTASPSTISPRSSRSFRQRLESLGQNGERARVLLLDAAAALEEALLEIGHLPLKGAETAGRAACRRRRRRAPSAPRPAASIPAPWNAATHATWLDAMVAGDIVHRVERRLVARADRRPGRLGKPRHHPSAARRKAAARPTTPAAKPDAVIPAKGSSRPPRTAAVIPAQAGIHRGRDRQETERTAPAMDLGFRRGDGSNGECRSFQAQARSRCSAGDRASFTSP